MCVRVRACACVCVVLAWKHQWPCKTHAVSRLIVLKLACFPLLCTAECRLPILTKEKGIQLTALAVFFSQITCRRAHLAHLVCDDRCCIQVQGPLHSFLYSMLQIVPSCCHAVAWCLQVLPQDA